MDRNDVCDLLAVVQAVDARQIEDYDIDVWFEMIGRFDKDDCLQAIMDFRAQEPGVWLEPGHVVRRVKVMINDRYERDEPDNRAQYTQSYGGVRLDRYGYVDKSDPDDDVVYPSDWSSEQRLQATWNKINALRNRRPGWDVPEDEQRETANPEVRREAMAKIREVLSGGSKFGRSV